MKTKSHDNRSNDADVSRRSPKPPKGATSPKAEPPLSLVTPLSLNRCELPDYSVQSRICSLLASAQTLSGQHEQCAGVAERQKLLGELLRQYQATCDRLAVQVTPLLTMAGLKWDGTWIRERWKSSSRTMDIFCSGIYEHKNIMMLRDLLAKQLFVVGVVSECDYTKNATHVTVDTCVTEQQVKRCLDISIVACGCDYFRSGAWLPFLWSERERAIALAALLKMSEKEVNAAMIRLRHAVTRWDGWWDGTSTHRKYEIDYSDGAVVHELLQSAGGDSSTPTES